MATMQVCADIGDMVKIREFVVRSSLDLGVDEKIIPDLELVADELCSNVINHGYDGQCGWIEITLQPVEEGIQLRVRDWGHAFDPTSVPLPNVEAPLEQRTLGGLGLFLVRKLMDEVEFEASGGIGNVVTVVKRVRVREEA
jgi:anti-sigma regulatory factor (Ser/Thr protein kinase)